MLSSTARSNWLHWREYFAPRSLSACQTSRTSTSYYLKSPTSSRAPACLLQNSSQGHTATPRTGGQAAGKQVSFKAGARSLNEQDLRLHDNLHFFKVPDAGMESIRSKLVLKIYDEYVNVLRRMYSVRFNGSASRKGTSSQSQSAPAKPFPLSSTPSTPLPTKFRKHKGRRRRELTK